MKKILFSLVCLLSFTSFAFAQEGAVAIADTPLKEYDKNTAVVLEHTGSDSLGSRLLLELKEELNTSSLFTLKDDDGPKFRILLSTVPEFKERPGIGSAYSIVWVFSQSTSTLGHYIDSEVGLFTADEIEGLVAQILEKTDTYSVRYGYLFESE